MSFLLLAAAVLTKEVVGEEVRITNANEFVQFKNNVNRGMNYSGTTVFLDSDLSLAGETFEPIGNSSSKYFNGTFDGQGHVVSNFIMNSSSQYVGLFGYSRGLTIRNVVLGSSCSITSYYGSGNAYAGGIIGNCYGNDGDCTIENSVNMGSISFSGSITGSLHLGGISGYLYSYDYVSTVKNCANYGSVTCSGKNNGYLFIGGIVGFSVGSSNNMLIYNSINHGTITYSSTTSNSLHLGGIVGYTSFTIIKNCVNAGKISPSKSSYIGSIVGHVESGTFINYCYFTNDVGVNSLNGQGSPSSTGTPNTSSTLDLSLVRNLNSQATSNGWNMWILNSDSASVTFKVNNNKGFSVSKKVILLPTIAESGSNKFSGWYKEANYNQLFQSNSVTDTTTLHGLYKIVSTVTFNSNGGNTPSSAAKTVTYNDTYGDLPETTETGYTFGGWYTEIEGGEEVKGEDVVKIAGPHTLYAYWTPNQYTVTFDGNNGTLSQLTKEVLYDSPYGDLPEPSRSGYAFLGWFTEGKDGEEITNETEVSITRPQTLYAHWTIAHIIVFISNGGSGCEPIIQDYNTAVVLPEPTKTGYTFDCWCSDPELNSEYTATTMPAERLILYAKWAINQYNLTFVFNNGGENEVRTLGFNETVDYQENVEKIGYTFNGWDKEISTMPAEDLTITAQWTPNKYSVTFNANGGDVSPSSKEVIFENTYGKLPDADRVGYTFEGWFNEKDDEVNSEDVVKVTVNQTLYARWTPNVYTVSFDVNGGDPLSESESAKEVTFDSPYGELPTLTRKGCGFIEWAEKTTDKEVNNLTTVSIPNDHTLYAIWDINKYRISFNFENGTTATFVLSFNDSITYPNENPSKVFHKFTKWCVSDENGIKTCDLNNVPEGNLIFIPSFEVNTSLVAGTAAVAFAVVVLIIVIILVIILLGRTKSEMKKKCEFIELVDLSEDGKCDKSTEERILRQAETTTILPDIKEKLAEPLKKADKSKGVEEILADLDVDCEEGGSAGVVDSFRTTTVSGSIADTIKNGGNLAAASEFLVILYSTVREQEDYEEFEELYFGMKNIDNFMDKMDEETISFGGVVSGFTSKGRAIQSLFSDDEESSVLSGVLFRVHKGKGYRIGEVDEETDEVLFEIESAFKVESVREVTKGKYFVADLSFVSPESENEILEL